MVEKSYQHHPRYTFVQGDATNVGLMKGLARPCDHLVAGAARIGGISYFHEYAYDLLAENERIVAATFDAAIEAFQKGELQKITVLSSSMVFENATKIPNAREPSEGVPAAVQHLRLSETGLRVFCQGGLGAIPAAVHHRPTVQLRGDRRTAGRWAPRRFPPAT